MITRHHISAVVSCLVFSACAPWPLQVTPRLSGTVVDMETKQPIAGANVHIVEFPQSAVITGANGSFQIEPLRKWQVAVLGTDLGPVYTLKAEANGYLPSERHWDVGDDRSQTIELHVAASR